MLLFSVLMFQFYSTFIVGSLLTDAPKNIKTVKQLLNSPFEFGVDAVPYVIDNFHIAKEESTVQLYNKIMKNPEKVVMSLETGVNLMKRGIYIDIFYKSCNASVVYWDLRRATQKKILRYPHHITFSKKFWAAGNLLKSYELKVTSYKNFSLNGNFSNITYDGWKFEKLLWEFEKTLITCLR